MPRGDSWQRRPDTYWRRRVIVFAGVLGILGLVAWACSAAGGGPGNPRQAAAAGTTAAGTTAAAQQTASSAAPTSVPEAADTAPSGTAPSGTAPSGTARPGRARPGPRKHAAAPAHRSGSVCAPGDLVISLLESRPTYAQPTEPRFTIYLVNAGRRKWWFHAGRWLRQPRQRLVRQRSRQVLQNRGAGLITHPITQHTGAEADGLDQVAFPDTALSHPDQVLPAADELAPSQRLDPHSIDDLGIELPIEVGQGLVLGEPARRMRWARLRSRRALACSLIKARKNSRCDIPSLSARLTRRRAAQASEECASPGNLQGPAGAALSELASPDVVCGFSSSCGSDSQRYW